MKNGQVFMFGSLPFLFPLHGKKVLEWFMAVMPGFSQHCGVQHCLSVGLLILTGCTSGPGLVFFVPLFGAFNMKYSILPLLSTTDSGMTLQRTVTTVLGAEHILHLWLLCGCVFSWSWGPANCDLAVWGGILLCLPPAELGLEKTALQSFLGTSEVLQPAGVFVAAQTGCHCRSALCSAGRSQLGFSKEFILSLCFLYSSVLCL